MQHMRLASTMLDFWVDVAVLENGGKWLAVAKISGEPEIGMGDSLSGAVSDALQPFGPEASNLLMKSISQPKS